MGLADMVMVDMDRPTTAAVGVAAGAAAMLRHIMAGGGQVIMAAASEDIAVAGAEAAHIMEVAVGAEAAHIMGVAVGVAEAVGIMGVVVVDASDLS